MKFRLLEVFVLCSVLVLNATAQTPLIISQPQSVTVNNASAAAFTVVATNAATYQWLFQGTNNLTGETNATLYLDDLSTNQAGSYSVVVTSSNNISTNSAPAVLTIVPGTIVQWTISTYPDGSSSNLLVQLFDHDKPATVENFIHYITSGVYSNTFFDRDVTNFVLQGGDYTTSDRTNALNVQRLSVGTNVFPAQLDNEYSVGPLIHNHFGTLAMAQLSGETNSATSAFYFNLADNSASLDPQYFTVFGRILTGTNVLQYFNTLSPPDNGIYPYFSAVTNLPVDYDGTNSPNDNNFFYCDFSFQSPPPVDTNRPTVSITYPTPNAVFTNGTDLHLAGTASDNVGLAEVYCVLTPLTGADEGENQTNAAIGASLWSIDLGTNPPGIYRARVFSQDGAGNLSPPSVVFVTNLATLTVITNVNGQLSTNQQYIVPGQPYSVTAPELAGEQFLDWLNQGETSIDPAQSVTAEDNLTLTVIYVATNMPPGLAITSPVAGSVVIATNAALTISGTIPTSVSVTQLTVQLFFQSNAVTAALPAVINGGNWSLAESNLASGPYTVLVEAEDSAGDIGLATENFTAQAPPIIISEPTNIAVLSGATATLSVTAANVATYQWQLVGTGAITGATNATLVFSDVSSNLSGSIYEVVLTSPDGLTVTSTPAMLTVVTGTLVQITFSGFPDGSTSNVVVQLFDHEKPATVANFLHYITPVVEEGDITNIAYSNMVWDRCVPGFILQGGDYDSTDRTNTTPPPHLQSINEFFTENLVYTPAFPFSIANEFSNGPVIHNTFGTLAMAKIGGEPDSAANSFFFNLADNSTNLDNQNGGYTVFGQIISGSNVLQYFNTLSKPTGGIFDATTTSADAPLPNLPVNYHGWTVPANANLFYGAFTLLSAYNPDTTPPAIALNYPTNGQTVTNVDVVFQGTASDNVAVARVVCSFNGGLGTVDASGTTNWTADLGTLAPGSYTYRVVAQDGSGNITASTNAATGTFIVPRWPFEATTNGNGTLSTNLDGTNTTVGARYTITAKPNKGATFVNWVMGSNTFLSATTNFTMQNGLQMTANFISNTVPGGISITYPKKFGELTNTTYVFKGKLAPSIGPAQVSCQVFSAFTGNSISAAMVFNATNTWASPSTSLAPGSYIVQVIAQGANGRSAVTTEEFWVTTKLTIITYGQGSATFADGTYLVPGQSYYIEARPARGSSFLSWNAGEGSVPLQTIPFTMSEGLTLTETFVSNAPANKLAFTSPKPRAQVAGKNVTLEGTLASSPATPQVLCQLYLNNEPLTGFVPAAVNGTSWTLPVTNLSMGVYDAVALVTDAAGNNSLASVEFLVNYFPLLAGTYHGLFFDPLAVAGTNAGTVSFTLGNNGLVDGNLTFPLHKPYLLYFQLGSTGSAFYQTPGFSSSVPIYLSFNFDFTNLTSEMTGYISQGREVCPLIAYRATSKLSTSTTPATGTYVLNLEPVMSTNEALEGPLGDSFASVVVSPSGNLAVAGTMADNSTPFSFSTGVYTNGVWPFCASFDKGNGMVIGWETNLPSGASTGTLYWSKNPKNGSYFSNGISEELSSVGAKFVSPAAGVSYQIVFGGGTLESLVTNVCSFKNGIMVPAEGTADKLTGSVSSKGVLKGSIVNPFNNGKLSFNGGFISQTNGGGGFTLDVGNQTGYFEIGALPP